MHIKELYLLYYVSNFFKLKIVYLRIFDIVVINSHSDVSKPIRSILLTNRNPKKSTIKKFIYNLYNITSNTKNKFQEY